jgi:hypothetical protein
MIHAELEQPRRDIGEMGPGINGERQTENNDAIAQVAPASVDGAQPRGHSPGPRNFIERRHATSSNLSGVF